MGDRVPCSFVWPLKRCGRAISGYDSVSDESKMKATKCLFFPSSKSRFDAKTEWRHGNCFVKIETANRRGDRFDRALSSVDLPAPLAPISATSDPGCRAPRTDQPNNNRIVSSHCRRGFWPTLVPCFLFFLLSSALPFSFYRRFPQKVTTGSYICGLFLLL